MDEQGFKQLLAEKPHDPELLLIYADWLEEHGREDEALAARLRRVVKDRADLFTRAQAEAADTYNARRAREWFAKYPQLLVFIIGYVPVTKLGLQYMPMGMPGLRRSSYPANIDPTSPVVYYRKSKGYSGMQAAFVRVPG
jgi:uncharacterized protein (TIGR02996 family)